ncbi:hypothetical protein ACI65C_012855 [Semiaphis heraclei]
MRLYCETIIDCHRHIERCVDVVEDANKVMSRSDNPIYFVVLYGNVRVHGKPIAKDSRKTDHPFPNEKTGILLNFYVSMDRTNGTKHHSNSYEKLIENEAAYANNSRVYRVQMNKVFEPTAVVVVIVVGQSVSTLQPPAIPRPEKPLSHNRFVRCLRSPDFGVSGYGTHCRRIWRHPTPHFRRHGGLHEPISRDSGVGGLTVLCKFGPDVATL